MNDLLLSAAKRLEIPTEANAGPGGRVTKYDVWARWPRHPCEVAQDVLSQVVRITPDASVTPVGGTPLWRARYGRWTHIGRFEDAVANLAIRVLEGPKVSAPKARPRGELGTTPPANALGHSFSAAVPRSLR